MYTELPYFGIQSEKLKTELVNLVRNFFPYIDLKVILVNDFKIYINLVCAPCDTTYVG